MCFQLVEGKLISFHSLHISILINRFNTNTMHCNLLNSLIFKLSNMYILAKDWSSRTIASTLYAKFLKTST